MNNQSITIFINYMICALSGIIFILSIGAILLAFKPNDELENIILKELKKIKNEYYIKKTYKYKKNKIIWFISILIPILLIIMGFLVLDIEYIKKTWYEIILIIIAITFICIKYGKSTKGIKIVDTLLLISYPDRIEEYNINDIGGIKVRAVWGTRTREREFSLYINNKGKYDVHNLNSFYNRAKLFALAIFIKYIKENRLNEIDTITEKEILELEDEIIM